PRCATSIPYHAAELARSFAARPACGALRKRRAIATAAAPTPHAASNRPSDVNTDQRPNASGTTTAVAIATPRAHLSRVHKSGSDAFRHAATGPIPIKNTSGVIGGTNTESKYGGPTEILPRFSASMNSGYSVPSSTLAIATT